MLHVALLVCTYRRPRLFQDLMASVDALDVPRDVTLHLAVADNTPEGATSSYVPAVLAASRFATSFRHEPVRGYASARNATLTLGLATPATVFLTTDDDQRVPSSWLRSHLDGLARHAADVAVGGIIGEPAPYRDGQSVGRVSTRNVSFRRRLIDPAGMGLAFDVQFDSTGHEDHDFFDRAAARGARIAWIDGADIHDNDPIVAEDPDAWLDAARNRAEVSRASQRNKTVQLRRDGKRLALALHTLGSSRDFAKGFVSYAAFLGCRVVRPADAASRLASARKHTVKGLGRLEGLFKDGIARQDVRRGDKS